MRIVAPAKAAVGQQRLSEFGRTLDFVEEFKAAAERGVGLGPIAHSLVDLPQDTMGRNFFETEATPLRGGKRLANGTQGLVVTTRSQMDLGAGDLRI